MDLDNMTSYPKMIKQLYSENGIRSLYRGYWSTFWRDVPLFGAYFFVYEFLCKQFIKPTDNEVKKHFKLVMIGGLAGTLNWVPSFPIDVVKTII